MAELQDIIDQIVLIQKDVTPPTGEKDVTVYDEPPEAVQVFPSFLNIERETEELNYMAPIIIPYIIDMHLIFGAFDKKYAYRSKRLWIQPVRVAFATNGHLNGSVNGAWLHRMDFHPEGFTYGAIEYDAITFTLQATVQDLTARSA